MEKFEAFVLDQRNDQPHTEIRQMTIDELSEGDVTIRVAYSSVNYKDGSVVERQMFVKNYPLIPGIDLAGTVLTSKDKRFKEGDEVIVTSYGLGTDHDGGYSEVARVPANWIVPLPEGLTLREAMILGTAGFTAGLSVQRLEDNGLESSQGSVLVAGSTGGVGSIAVDILAKKGYDVVASTGKLNEHEYLKRIGAKKVINRDEVIDNESQPFREEKWAGAIDPVGGKTLQYILTTLQYGTSVATSGLTGGMEVATTVGPFIGRGVNWLGIDSVNCPMNIREKVWQRLASDLKPEHLNEDIVKEISMEELPVVLTDILEGKNRGRTIVKM
ncbi:acryloyl-CoA reductase [Aquibacillus halophilus]|uniref:Acryloyl-CoA reductase n=1 Tax=Aquibacillus halophilus TaxID=930132 RepID=A0A6A8DG09_9BACI|nr:acryloyl-CoA reductase [Aquibacillus halophilus]MRH41797.1 acryloyl-CoA reductase [Aquibacillus halophilus]